ncbi:hypothetical protein ACH4F6_31515 [Streptomyces sp. NPDC017936]|uniref:hypothetical protein n=1 Tax=Streptomyces sp. NPDC017936 TaxID=3365016 RepID=UPI00378E0B67
MARYLITYMDGETETINADNIEPSGGQYIGWAGDGSAVAYIPAGNVRSIVRQDDGEE